MNDNLNFILAFLIGIFLGVIIILILSFIRNKKVENKATKMIEQAKKEAEKQKRDSLLEFKEESYRLKQEEEKEIK